MLNVRKATLIRLCLAGVLITLVACGGGSSSGAAAPSTNTPPATSGPDQTRDPVAYRDAEQLFAFITGVSIPDDGRPLVSFQLTDQNNTAILDLTVADIRLGFAKLNASPMGNLTGDWQSYINRIEQPGVGQGDEPRLQGTTESGGELINNQNGTYQYRFASDVRQLSSAILDQAAKEGLNLAYEPSRTHRAAIQFSNSRSPANPVFDFVPATGATSNIFHRDITATESCNKCHDTLAMHGGGRVAVEFCVTCHNPGSSDANSGNSVDFKVMIHKLHRGRDLPSVQSGTPYVIYGYGGTAHDYSTVGFPQDIRNCTTCHAGTATGVDGQILTRQGDNWNEYASQAACGSCHDDMDFSQHFGGQADDTNCMSCHSVNGPAGTIASRHRNLINEARPHFAAHIEAVTQTAPGQMPMVSFRLTNPLTGTDYDIVNDPEWANGRLALTLSWATKDYANTGNNAENASAHAISVANAVSNGDGSYTVTSDLAIPDASLAPNVAASGSGTVVIEGRAAVDVDGDGALDQVPLINAHADFSIDEPNAIPVARRQVVGLEKCLDCHQHLDMHGNSRSDNLNSCVTCHNPRNTDRLTRAMAVTPPTDGKTEETLDFKVMVHAIHASAMRDEPLQIVGYQGRSTYVFDEDKVHFPGKLGNCVTCHTDQGYKLPLAAGVLATTVDTSASAQDPSDDIVMTPIAAVCSSCHDDTVAKAHMTQNGANFSTSQAAIDAASVVEQCNVCHGDGRSAALDLVHPVN